MFNHNALLSVNDKIDCADSRARTEMGMKIKP